MKRYLLFCGEWYYPEGGMNDFIGSFEKKQEAINKAMQIKKDVYKNDTDFWYHVMDIETYDKVSEGGRIEA